MIKYPTKKIILKKEVLFKKQTIKIMLNFKEKWKLKKRKTNKEKQTLLKSLIKKLEKEYNKKVEITFNANKICCYDIKQQRININKSLSIISTLHEFAHHIYGPSEKIACRWSIWLFKKTFEKEYKKLKWRGHMLIK